MSSALLAPLVGDAAGAATPSRIGTDAGKVACLLRDGMGLGGAAAILFGDLIFEALILFVGGGLVLWIAPFVGIAVAGAMGYGVVTLMLGTAAYSSPGFLPGRSRLGSGGGFA